MKLIDTKDAVGHVLCHDMTQIIPGRYKGPTFKKGHVVTEEDIPVLLSIGKEHLYIWEKDENMLHEDEAAQILYEICVGSHPRPDTGGSRKVPHVPCAGTHPLNMHPSDVSEGKIELIADCDGLLKIDREKLLAVNSLGEMMIASRHGNTTVKKGDKLAGTRVIPLVIEKEKMERARQAAADGPIFRILPFTLKKAAILTTGSEVCHGLIEGIKKLGGLGHAETYFLQPLRLREDLTGGAVGDHTTFGHNEDAVSLGCFHHMMGDEHNGDAVFLAEPFYGESTS